MKSKIRFKNYICWLLVLTVIFVSAVFAYSLFAQNIGFTPRNPNWDVDNVASALDDLYDSSVVTIPGYIKKLLADHNKRYTFGLKDLLSDPELYDIIINEYDFFDPETLDAFINSRTTTTNFSYTRKLKTIIEGNYTVTTTPIQTNNNKVFGTAQYDSSGNWNLWKAFDGTSSDYAYRGNGSFYLGFIFDNPLYVYDFSLIQRSSVEGVDNVTLYYSDDNSNWTIASDTYTTQHTGGKEQHFLANKSYGKHRYWKIQGTGYGNNGGMVELEFYGME